MESRGPLFAPAPSRRATLQPAHASLCRPNELPENALRSVRPIRAGPADLDRDFCLIPMGVDTVGVTKYVAECQRVLETTGLVHTIHGYGTGVEGEFGEVMKAIEACHAAVHALGCVRTFDLTPHRADLNADGGAAPRRDGHQDRDPNRQEGDPSRQGSERRGSAGVRIADSRLRVSVSAAS